MNEETLKENIEKQLEENEVIIKIRAGGQHNIIMTNKGNIYGWGNNQEGQIGNNSNANAIEQPIKIKIKETIKDIITGYNHTLALTEKGNIYAWGSNGDGQCGIDTKKKTIKQPTKMTKSIPNIVEIGVGYNHNVILTKEGTLYSWGWNYYGQCGRAHSEVILEKPEQINHDIEDKIIQLAVGYNHNLVLTQKGYIYSWGSNSMGECGIVNQQKKCLKVTKIDVFTNALKNEHIVNIRAGYQTSFAITNLGNVYCWGENRFGQAGAGKQVTIVPQPTLLQAFDNETIVDVYTGGYHNIAKTQSGKLYCWGLNTSGECGVGHLKEAFMKPILLAYFEQDTLEDNEIITQCALGYHHSLALSSLGNLFCWGQIHPKQQLVMIPTPLTTIPLYKKEKIIQYLFDHSLILANTGQVYTYTQDEFILSPLTQLLPNECIDYVYKTPSQITLYTNHNRTLEVKL